MSQLGSKWNNGTNCGPFYWNLNNTVSNRNRNIGSRTAAIIKIKVKFKTMPLGKRCYFYSNDNKVYNCVSK